MNAKLIELETEAVALIKRYGFYLPAPVKNFLRKLSDVLGWQKVRYELK